MNDTSSWLYFAYGSNMLSRRLLARTPSARVVAVARLPQHELRWHMAGGDGSGKCDVVPVASVTAEVHGVVYRLDLADKPRLDAAESLGHGYAERQVALQTALGPLQAQMYQALRTDPGAVPYTWYKAIVLGGAEEHDLDPDYRRRLQAVPARDDPDPARAALHFSLLDR